MIMMMYIVCMYACICSMGLSLGIFSEICVYVSVYIASGAFTISMHVCVHMYCMYQTVCSCGNSMHMYLCMSMQEYIWFVLYCMCMYLYVLTMPDLHIHTHTHAHRYLNSGVSICTMHMCVYATVPIMNAIMQALFNTYTYARAGSQMRSCMR
jgi:hypothetical protein